MKFRLDTVLSLLMFLAFFLPWGKGFIAGSGYSFATSPNANLQFLFVVPVLAGIVFLTSFMPIENRWARILAGLIPLVAVIWAINTFSGQMNLGVFEFLKLVPAFLTWGFYISLALASALLLNGIWGLKKSPNKA